RPSGTSRASARTKSLVVGMRTRQLHHLRGHIRDPAHDRRPGGHRARRAIGVTCGFANRRHRYLGVIRMVGQSDLVSGLSGQCRSVPAVSGPRAELVLIPRGCRSVDRPGQMWGDVCAGVLSLGGWMARLCHMRNDNRVLGKRWTRRSAENDPGAGTTPCLMAPLANPPLPEAPRMKADDDPSKWAVCKNRRLSLRWFEPNTFHTLRKRPASCD